MISTAELADLRADAVREMPDMVRLLRRTEDVLRPDTLVVEPVYVVVADEVPAFITRTDRPVQVEQSGRPMEHDRYLVVLDPAVTDVRNGDVIEVQQSGDAATPHLIVMSITAGSATAGRRVYADRFGDGQTEPLVVLGGFGVGGFGTQPFGGL